MGICFANCQNKFTTFRHANTHAMTDQMYTSSFRKMEVHFSKIFRIPSLKKERLSPKAYNSACIEAKVHIFLLVLQYSWF